MDSTQALNTISSVSGAYNAGKYQRYRRKEIEGIVLRSSNSSGRAQRDTWPLHESPTSSSVEKVILGVDTNRKEVRERGEESPNVQE